MNEKNVSLYFAIRWWFRLVYNFMVLSTVAFVMVQNKLDSWVVWFFVVIGLFVIIPYFNSVRVDEEKKRYKE